MDDNELVSEAFNARENAYAPYSGYKVGAALLTKSGRVYHGCNIENAAYSPTNCAERTAFFKAISEGDRDFAAIAIVGAHKDAAPEQYTYFYPCGVCRQVMAEFCEPDSFRIITARGRDEYQTRTLRELLPDGFGSASLTND